MSYYVGDPMLDAGMSELDKVTVLQDFMLLWINEQNHNGLEVKSSMKKRVKCKKIKSDGRKYCDFYFTDEDTERLNDKLVNYRVSI